MKPEELELAYKVVHRPTGKQEQIVATNLLMKDSANGWVKAVLYSGFDENTGEQMLFVRERTSFIENFDVIEQWQRKQKSE